MSQALSGTPLLASILVEWGIVSEAQVEQGRARQRVTGGRLGETLVDLGYATEESIGRTLAKALGVPFTSVDLSAVDPAVVNRFHVGVLRRALAMPLIDSGGQIVVAMADPTDRAAVTELRSGAGAPLSIVVGAPSAIRRALAEYLGVEAGEIEAPATSPPATPSQAAGSQAVESTGRPSPAAGAQAPSPAPPRAEAPRVEPTRRVEPVRRDPPRTDSPRIEPLPVELIGVDPLLAGPARRLEEGDALLTRHIEAAHMLRASEIHFVPSGGSTAVFYRTDRGLEAHGSESAGAARALRAALGALGVPDLSGDDATEAHGWGALTAGEGRVQIGASHCRGNAGVSTVVRIGPHLSEAPEVSKLGLTPLAEAELFELVEGPEGVVIVYGPPHSGGSTVLASLASLARRKDRRLVVLEPSSSAPYPDEATRVRFGDPSEAERAWTSLLLGQGADIMVLDGVLHGAAIEGVLSGATVGRLVFARTDWLDGRELLRCLTQSRHARVALRDRPFVMIELPGARRDGSAVWSPAEAGGLSPGTLHATLLSNEDRDALIGGR